MTQPLFAPRDLTVGFAGMTHLGIVSSSVIAARGFKTVCYDANIAVVASLRDNDLPVQEPELDDLVKSNAGRQSFTTDIASIGACDIVYIAPDVPTDDTGTSDLTEITRLIDRVAAALKPEAILVVLCQVPPGFTRAITSIDHARLYYQVETLVFGIAVQRAREPERYIVGCARPERPLDSRLSAFLAAAGCTILPMRYESAELAKIAINCCLVASISVANTLSEVCETVGADWSEIVPSLKLDARIGPKSYLAPGLGIAGGNLERDLATIMAIAKQRGVNDDVVRAWVSNSRHRRGWAARTIEAALLAAQPNATVAVWGLAYKENTASIKNSPSLATIAALPSARFVVHDPVVRSETLRQVSDPLDALPEAEALMILTPWPIYRTISLADIAASLRGRLVIDPYRVLDRREALAHKLDYRTLGVVGRAWPWRVIMLHHRVTAPRKPDRVVIIGGRGFVGDAVRQRLVTDGVEVVSIGRDEANLQDVRSADTLARMLRSSDSVVFSAARAPCRDLSMMIDNMTIVQTVMTALTEVPVAHVVNISSDAVYGDEIVPITETMAAAPTTMHGVMHLAREIALATAFQDRLAILRPTLVYGAQDPHSGYGPNRFRRLAMKGEDIALFGAGEERRDHVLVDDVAEIVRRVLWHGSIGVLNIATGSVHSFHAAAELAVAAAGSRTNIRATPRTGPMPHNGYRAFDPTLTKTAFPDFTYVDLPDGMRRVQSEVNQDLEVRRHG